MGRFVCIHGHFYQPPRENPWLDEVERQPSAAPYHDWNQRITAECYAPNTAARLLDADGLIRRVVNNYERLSFDAGPTLLAWLERQRPEVYAAILAADGASRERCGGHGAAMAQAHSHVILPLASRRDKETQIAWGLRDFAHRFGRPSSGLWLPETAVDVETLEVAAAQGVAFTVLEPAQARRVRALVPAGTAPPPWRDVRGGRLDTTQPYLVTLPSGRSLAVFFYDGALARAVAFESLLASGEAFAERILAAAPRDGDRLIHLATDGETYGHHFAHGDMALATALERLEAGGQARVTNYAEYLAGHRPEQEVELVSPSSWSCAHGVDRWREDCGCRTGGPPEWNQAWRAPLRDALDGLRDALLPRYEAAAGELFADPWLARNEAIDLSLDRSAAARERFFARHARHPLARPEQVRALSLLELVRQSQFMFTSCGWFFSDLGGLETIQILRYAGRAVQLGEALFGEPLEEEFLRRLAWARSNDPQVGDGRELYAREVRSAIVDTAQIVAHYALRSLYEPAPAQAVIGGHTIVREDGNTERAGRARLELGWVLASAVATGEEERYCFGAIALDDHDPHVACGVRRADSDGGFDRLAAEAAADFALGKVQQALRLLDRGLGLQHSLDTLRPDARHALLEMGLGATVAEVEVELRDGHRRLAALLRYLEHLGEPAPPALRVAAQFVVNADLERQLSDPASDPAAVPPLLAEAKKLGLELDGERLGRALAATLAACLAGTLAASGEDGELGRAVAWSGLAAAAPFPTDLWSAQNLALAVRDRSTGDVGEPVRGLLSELCRNLALRFPS